MVEPGKLTCRRMALGLALPWLLLGTAVAGAYGDRSLYRSGVDIGWLSPVVLVWFFVFGFSAGILAGGLLLHAIWRLAWHRCSRRYSSGWVWPILTWLNLCGLSEVASRIK